MHFYFHDKMNILLIRKILKFLIFCASQKKNSMLACIVIITIADIKVQYRKKIVVKLKISERIIYQ